MTLSFYAPWTFLQVWKFQRKGYAQNCEYCVRFICLIQVINTNRDFFFWTSLSSVGHTWNIRVHRMAFSSSYVLHPCSEYLLFLTLPLLHSTLAFRAGSLFFVIFCTFCSGLLGDNGPQKSEGRIAMIISVIEHKVQKEKGVPLFCYQ